MAKSNSGKTGSASRAAGKATKGAGKEKEAAKQKPRSSNGSAGSQGSAPPEGSAKDERAAKDVQGIEVKAENPEDDGPPPPEERDYKLVSEMSPEEKEAKRKADREYRRRKRTKAQQKEAEAIAEQTTAMLLNVINGLVEVMYGEDCRMTEIEQMMIEDPLTRIISRMDFETVEEAGPIMDYSLVIVGMGMFANRIVQTQKAKKRVIAGPVPKSGQMPNEDRRPEQQEEKPAKEAEFTPDEEAEFYDGDLLHAFQSPIGPEIPL